MKMTRSSGFAGYAFITLWFLLMWMTPSRAMAQTSVTAADILPTIEAALMERGASADVRVEIENAQVAVRLNENGEAQFDSVSYNPASGRFLIRASSLGAGAPAVIAGRASSPVRLPVLDPALLGRLFATGSREDWVAKLRAGDIVSAPINTMLEAAVDPDVVANGYVAEVDYPAYGKRLKVHGTPWKFSETPAKIGVAPKLGEHNDEVLTSLGYSQADIAGFRERKAI